MWVVVERRARSGRRKEGGSEGGGLVICRTEREIVRVVILVVVIDGYSGLTSKPYGILGYFVTGRTACQAGTSTDIRITNIFFEVQVIIAGHYTSNIQAVFQRETKVQTTILCFQYIPIRVCSSTHLRWENRKKIKTFANSTKEST